MFFLGGKHLHEGALLQGRHVDLGYAVGARRIADDINQPIDRMQTAQQIVVLTIRARQECREVGECDALEAANSLETLESARILRADTVDQYLVELTDL